MTLYKIRAEEGTWTLKVLLPHGPEPCASANSATSAFAIAQIDESIRTIIILYFSKISKHFFYFYLLSWNIFFLLQ